MNKLFYILFSLVIFVLLCFFIMAYIAMYEPMHYRYHYEYVDMKGQEGIAATCYTIEDGRFYCRNSKKPYQVAEYEKVKERK